MWNFVAPENIHTCRCTAVQPPHGTYNVNYSPLCVIWKEVSSVFQSTGNSFLFSDLQLLTKHFMLFLGQCLGTSRTDWSRRICSKSSCRSSPVLWGSFPGRLPITKARYAIFLYPDLIYPCTNIIKGLNISATAKFGDMSNLH